MTIDEMSVNYSIGIEKLKYFAENGLIEFDGEYDGDELRRIGTMCRLREVGLDADDIRTVLCRETENRTDECLAILNCRRECILNNIHREQKMLDEIDYLIRKTKGGN